MPRLESRHGDDQVGFVSRGPSHPVQRIKAVMEPVVRMVMPAKSKTPGPRCTPEVDFEAMKSEAERLRTYSAPPAWNVGFVSPGDLAKAGLFSMHLSDKVQCAFCRGVIGEWEMGDEPLKEHKRHYPRCPFVSKLPVGNIPIGEERGKVSPQNSNTSAESLGIEKCSGPANKSMVSVSSRLKSYVEMNWPASTGQTPESMSAAGFYYVGNQDHVKCFYCGGGLKNWIAGDNPMEVHARWFPNCIFVSLNKAKPVVSSSILQEEPQRSSSEAAVTTSTQSCSKTGKDLMEELKRLREARRCKVCKDKDATVVNLPCGHLASCRDCAKSSKNCSICQQPVKAIVRTFS